MAVTFFFQLSGFVNTFVNEVRCADYNDARWQQRFWYRRIARLGPVYILMLICSLPPLMVAWQSIEVPPFETETLRFVACIATAMGVQTWDFFVPLWRLWNYPAWAVSCELAFYLAFPFLLQFIKFAILTTTRQLFLDQHQVSWQVFLLLFGLCVLGQISTWHLFQFALESTGLSSHVAGDVAYTSLQHSLHFHLLCCIYKFA